MPEIGTSTSSIINGINSISTAATAIATFGLVAFSLFQWLSTKASVKESTRLRYSQLILPVEKTMFNLRSSLEALRKFNDDWTKWDEKNKKMAERVGDRLEHIAHLCEKEMIDPEYVKDAFGRDFVKSWEKLATYLRQRRDDVNNGTQYLKHYEIFAYKCAKHLKIHMQALHEPSENLKQLMSE